MQGLVVYKTANLFPYIGFVNLFNYFHFLAFVSKFDNVSVEDSDTAASPAAFSLNLWDGTLIQSTEGYHKYKNTIIHKFQDTMWYRSISSCLLFKLVTDFLRFGAAILT